MRNQASEDRKWVTTARGPLLIIDRAAPLLKLSGFHITLNSSVGKHWEKAQTGLVHRVMVSSDGSWSHQTASEEQLLNGLASFHTQGEGRNHRDLMAYLGNNSIFGDSTRLEATT